MRNHTSYVIAAAAAAVIVSACSRAEPAKDAAPTAAPADARATEIDRRRNDDAGRLEERVNNLERRWREMEGKVADKAAMATVGLREELREDVKNARQAVADLRTTTPENWWERHERAMERTAEDIEGDVRRLTKDQPASSPARAPESAAHAAPFESRRDQFVTSLTARVDAMEKALKDVRATGVQQTELQDTRARVNKLKDDVDRLRNASADDWWEITSKRVSEYVDRVEDSVRRMDDNKP